MPRNDPPIYASDWDLNSSNVLTRPSLVIGKFGTVDVFRSCKHILDVIGK